MEGLEGWLLVPPDRSQILNRAAWKPRYVVVGRRSVISRRNGPQSPGTSHFSTSTRVAPTIGKPAAKALNDEDCVSIYKAREDIEPIQQWPLSSVAECAVQAVASRKQGLAVPTLIVTFADKERKRRSSRATGFIPGSKDSCATTLSFRKASDDYHPTLQDWARAMTSTKGTLSPSTPVSPAFTNPFSPRSREASDYFPRPGSGSQGTRGDYRSLHHKSSTATYSTGTRERPMTLSSDSPSLRSKRSDISSPSIHNQTYQAMNPALASHFSGVAGSDIPSPITSIGESRGELIEGWTSAQGRSSVMSSPVQERGSISSQAQQQSLTDSSSPPGPRETILDRAFQLNYIPGAERDATGEDKMTSLARFDALMREADEKRRMREAAALAQQAATKSAFEADDSSVGSDDIIPAGAEDTDSDDGNYVHEQDGRGQQSLITSVNRQNPDYWSSRDEPQVTPMSPRPTISRTALSFHGAQTPLSALERSAPARPHTSHAKNRPYASQRSLSNVQLPPALPDSNIRDLDTETPRSPEHTTLRPRGDKRQSNNSAKRLSFTEFTKRLSSSSSLLLVQANNSGSGRAMIDGEGRPVSMSQASVKRSSTQTAKEGDGEDQEKSCGWRSSVGLVGTEGGFI